MKLKIWLPFLLATGLALLLNLYPIFMAFVLKVEGWGQTGWIFYFFTIPIGGGLVLIGLAISLIWTYMQKKKEKQGEE